MSPGGPPVPNRRLARLREQAGLSQHDMAEELNALVLVSGGRRTSVTAKTVGRWERGEVSWPQPLHRRLLTTYFDSAIDELGFSSPQVPIEPARDGHLGDYAESHDDRQRWLAVRASLDQRRRELAIAATALYPHAVIPGPVIGGAISHSTWLPPAPIALEELALTLDTTELPPPVNGHEPATASCRPLDESGGRYRRYHHAIRDLASPKLFENRLCFRLLEVAWQPLPRLRFGLMGFFDAVDVNETLAHETADRALPPSAGATPELDAGRLHFRRLAGDPFDLRRRPVLGAVGTLTVRDGPEPTVVLHERDPSRVAGGGGMTHLLPAAVFQPASVMPAALATDFSLWRTIQREYAEELLGHDEYDGSGAPIDYAGREPFRTLDAGRDDGRVRVHLLGVTADALTLAVDVLTVAVIEPSLYDALFTEAVPRNAEGTVSTSYIPFDARYVDELLASGTLAPGAAAALQLAWRHRQALGLQR